MRAVEALAPGKAVLIGEYAVTRGARALALALDRQARVRLIPCAADECALSGRPLNCEALSFRMEPEGRLSWDQGSSAWAELQRTATLLSHLHKLAWQRFGDPGPYRVEIDTTALFVDTGQASVKLGLGSSSAVAVALDAALRCLFGGRQQSGLSMQALGRLLAPYRREQDGRGSGIDLATALCGGVISYQRQQDEVQVNRVTLPPDLALLLVWTGRQASTSHLLAIFEAWLERDPDAASQLLTEMQACCEEAENALARSDAEALVAQFSAYGRLMGTMGGLMGGEVVTPTMVELIEQAGARGIACKPSGAGGGDLALLAASDPGRLASMRDWLSQRGLFAFAPGMNDTGVVANWCDHDL